MQLSLAVGGFTQRPTVENALAEAVRCAPCFLKCSWPRSGERHQFRAMH